MAAAPRATPEHLGSSSARQAGARRGGQCWRSFPGRADQAAVVRAFLIGELSGCPVAEDVVLMADELACNAIRHSRSREPGGLFVVRLWTCPGQSVRVEVADGGGRWASPVNQGDPDDAGEAEWYRYGGRGLRIVAALAAAWGVRGDERGRTVWFTTGWNR